MFELLYFNFEQFEVDTYREISTLYGVNVLYNKGLQNKSSTPFFAGDNIFIKNLISVWQMSSVKGQQPFYRYR